LAKTFLIDIDDTIIFTRVDKCEHCGNVVNRIVKTDEIEIEKINKAYDNGHIILVFTGRDWLKFEETEKQLKEVGLKYHKLIMGKPNGVYIDKDSCKSIGDYFDT
jgi:hydroxymethylpyrimidine pyrophosphatase-like HAD family hydrolase